ncbi:MAG TPA: hypothetical protein VHF26_03215 [Trebonia sp.]|nr:hypothetical protein [Trebonia sp.]
MTVETSVESYLFTCIRCAARWTDSYEVSQVTDDEGVTRSFYRHHGAACEAPVGDNVECPHCHRSKARRDPLYGTELPGTADLPGTAEPSGAAEPPGAQPGFAVPGPRGTAGSPMLAGHGGAGTWHRFRFSAVVTLESTGRSRAEYLSGASGLLVRAPSSERPTLERYFPAIFVTGDDRPLRPGARGVPVTVSVPDDDAARFFPCGQHFAVWDGTDIGRGTVAQRVFFGWP